MDYGYVCLVLICLFWFLNESQTVFLLTLFANLTIVILFSKHIARKVPIATKNHKRLTKIVVIVSPSAPMSGRWGRNDLWVAGTTVKSKKGKG